MTGQDAEVICGEFQTGNLTAEESGEEWNIVLDIVIVGMYRNPPLSISVHPDYNITPGEDNSQYVYADMATIHPTQYFTEDVFSTANIITGVNLTYPTNSFCPGG